MKGETNLENLLAHMEPVLLPDEYAFCTSAQLTQEQALGLRPICTYAEPEGLSLILEKHQALEAGLKVESLFRCITLSVHSSLDAVGLTAAVANKLAQNEISANVVAAYFHDHIFVPASKAEKSLALLSEFQK